MTRSVIPFNTGWLYCPEDRAEFCETECDESPFEPVCLPHTNVELPYHNFDNGQYQFVSWYRRRFAVPDSLRGRRLFLDFDGVMMAAEVFVNGRRLAEHKGGYVPFSVDITEHVEPRAPNVVAVRVDSRERGDIPPCGGVVDYLTFGGIYREVRLRAVGALHVNNVFARPGNVLEEAKRLDVDVTLSNAGKQEAGGRVSCELLGADGQGVARAETEAVSVPVGEQATLTACFEGLTGVRLWDIDSPTLYTLRVSVLRDGCEADSTSARVGFRVAEFTAGGPFLLNGRPVNLRGLNRHQTFPYVGGAAPARLQRRDAEILRHELGLNIVRTSHYPQSPHFLHRCDELGLLVFEEIPGWQHIGDADWKEVSYNDLRGMIVRDRNHPSIVLWGVRINESCDDYDFYTETNRIAHELDPTRQTGGVRCFKGSELLEDVYTMNDFAHSGGDFVIREPRVVTRLDYDVPYMVTEFNGHMYPSKRFDNEERLAEHVRRHARVHDAIAGNDAIAGGIGWCAFDYNTHMEFGSGDRICYHGVSDIFRFPKYAAWLYESQIEPDVRPVLRVASRWKLGERSGGGVAPLMVLSNCDRIEVYVGDEKRGEYAPDREQFPHMPHPPILCSDLRGGWGGGWQRLRVVGYVGDVQVAEQCVAPDGVPAQLVLQTDHAELVADGADMTRVAFWAADRYGNVLPYADEPVSLHVEGPARLVGQNPFPLVGGVGALLLRAGRQQGMATVTASTARLSAQRATVRLTAYEQEKAIAPNG